MEPRIASPDEAASPPGAGGTVRTSRITAGARRGPWQVDLATMVRAEVVRRVSRVPISLRLEPGVLVDAAPTQLVRVLADLVDHAQRHADQVFQIEVRRNGRCAELVVEDDGDGMVGTDRGRTFRRSARPGGTNTGGPEDVDGLAAVRDIARAHSGMLRVAESAMGGARFVLLLPVAGLPEAGRRTCAATT
ncbi:hypothetical protein DPM19_13840 [Actinomadura craniellae]|uniref:histidine kinase n=1 Tax=Actinomadura craniellae TaxID=2231787 RepID=A0A365H714_9ACTN|nr:ATP-binding protein [Actinomadura craniellae]RAY14808.1 hypothetical protein DPM19_13840 [Actinomadura craniellae]